MTIDITAIQAACDGTTFPIATKRRAVDMPFMSSDLHDCYPWYYVCSDDGTKHAAFAAEEDAEFYAMSRTAIPQLLAEVERLTKERDEARDEIARLDGVVTSCPCPTSNRLRALLAEAIGIAETYYQVGSTAAQRIAAIKREGGCE